MDADEFRKRGKEMIDYVADYLESIEQRRVLPDVQPGYLSKLIPTEAPQEAEKWEDLFKDIERVIMPGVTHWHNPNFHAFFPTANSYPAIIADILSSGIACIGFSWISSPACTELEVVTMDWLAKMLDLPEFFLAESNGLGGGVIQGTASEAVLVALLAARNRALEKARQQFPGESDGVLFSKMVAYSSDQVHSAMPRATLMAAVTSRTVASDDQFTLRGDAFERAVEQDIANGLIPIYLCATLGTTPSCAFDPLTELGPVCQKHGIWMHVDAAYAGSAFICPEFRPLMNGIEYAESFDFNPHKWMEVNFDCSAMWIKDRSTVVNAFNVDPIFLRHQYQNVAPDYRHWQIPLGRRFRSLKLWFVLRLYGVKGLQSFIRKHVGLAHQFESLIKSDDRFELNAPVVLGLICFRYKGTNEQNEALLKRINDEAKIYMVPCTLSGKFCIRFAVAASRTEPRHIEFAWQTIVANLEQMLAQDGASGGQ